MSLKKLLGINYPILLSPMAGVSTPLLAAEVSNYGGLGSLGLGAQNIKGCTDSIIQTQSLTSKPFQVNFFCHNDVQSNAGAADWIDYMKRSSKSSDLVIQPKTIYKSFCDDDELMKLVIRLQVPIVSFHFGIPRPSQILEMKSAGITLIASVTSLPEARFAVNSGIDILVAQGVEAGGHRGTFSPAITGDSCMMTNDLVKLIKSDSELSNTLVVASGGIMTTTDVQKMLDLGADAVQLGTAFLVCKEANVSQDYRRALLDPKRQITQVTSTISGRPARGLVNFWHKYVDAPNRPPSPVYPVAYSVGKQIAAEMGGNGSKDWEAWWAGSNVRFIKDKERATDVLDDLTSLWKIKD